MPAQAYTPDVKLNELKSILTVNPTLFPRFVLPDGDQIASHFHITEVGHIAKRFIDCGGTLHERRDTCLLQTYVADDVDHRLTAATFAKILTLGDQVLPHSEVDVEVEYEDCAVTQAPITSAEIRGEHIELQLGEKHTDCLAKEACEIEGNGCGSGSADSLPAGACC